MTAEHAAVEAAEPIAAAEGDAGPGDPAGQGAPEEADLAAAEEATRARARLLDEIDKRIIGQRQVIEQFLVALFAGGHCLFVGVPGLAKTLLVQTLARALDLSFSRIQFTPDLMPSDITGTEVLQDDPKTGRRFFRFIEGPVFANLVLADEINRTPPKTQAALLQAMQEHRVSAGGATHRLPLPFHVFATQNPIEQEGTYPLPEAQLDRFMFEVDVGYPSEEEEVAIVQQESGDYHAEPSPVLSPDRLLALQGLVRRVPAAEHVVRHAVKLVRLTRPGEPGCPEAVQRYVRWGAGPRAANFLVVGAKARALLDGRHAARVEDVRALADPVLRHRLVRSFHAEAEGVTAADIVEALLRAVPA